MVDTLTDLREAVEQLTAANPAAVMAILAASALAEYVFPPFPGDTVTLAGAFAVAMGGLRFWPVFAAVTAGSVVGAGLDFAVGAALWRARARRLGGAPREASALEGLIAGFRRHGEAYLVINRFVPGVRALFFVAAGMAGMRTLPVLLYSAISAALWNLGIMGLGYALGDNLDALERTVHGYAIAAYAALAVVALALAARWWRVRRRSARSPR